MLSLHLLTDVQTPRYKRLSSLTQVLQLPVAETKFNPGLCHSCTCSKLRECGVWSFRPQPTAVFTGSQILKMPSGPASAPSLNPSHTCFPPFRPQNHSLQMVQTVPSGSFLATQWLKFGTFTAMGPGSIPGWGTRIPQEKQTKKQKPT